MAYYRKYRPQTIAELDSSSLREKLTATLSQKEIPHAYLFTGPKGLGKTSTARIIAKSINCENRKQGSVEPCNTCDQCVSITNGSNIDVLEIDGASNRGIDEIRDLREKIKLSPARAAKKVYIIDEVHMLTTEAFNALLKTIEEPPTHVVFIFCTTEPQKVPETIKSRCTHIALTKATIEELVRSLSRIVAGEKLDAEAGVLEEIARLSDGGFRDGAKLLEETVALSEGKKITKALLEGSLHTANIDVYSNTFLSLLSAKDTKKALQLVSQLIEEGVDIRYFISQLLLLLHSIVLEEVGVKEKVTRQWHMEIDEIQELVPLLEKAYAQTKYAVLPQLSLELLVISWTRGIKEQSEEKPDQEKSRSTGPTMKEVYKKEQRLKVEQILKGETKKPAEAKKSDTQTTQEDLPVDKEQLETLMDNIIYKIKPINHSVAGVLRGCSILNFQDGTLTFQTAYKFHKERLMEHKIQEILEQAVKEITGKQAKIVVELKT